MSTTSTISVTWGEQTLLVQVVAVTTTVFVSPIVTGNCSQPPSEHLVIVTVPLGSLHPLVQDLVRGVFGVGVFGVGVFGGDSGLGDTGLGDTGLGDTESGGVEELISSILDEVSVLELSVDISVVVDEDVEVDEEGGFSFSSINPNPCL